MRKIFSIVMACLCSLPLLSQDKEMRLFIDNLMQRMTLEQKIGQLNLHSAPGFISAQKVSESDKNLLQLRKGLLGGIYGTEDMDYLQQMQEIAMQSGAQIPLIFGLDVIHGDVTIFPIPLALASSWNLDLVELTARTAAREATAAGICWLYSPMVDITRDARWGRVAEGAGEDPWLGGEIAKAYIRGYQGDGTYSDAQHAMACVKHFALYGAAEAGRDYNQVFLDRQEAFNGYLRPYHEAVKAGAGSMMSSFNEFEGIPLSVNRYMLTYLLRGQWGFDGFVVSDANAVAEVINHGIGDLSTVSRLAVQAGLDMDMNSDGFVSTLQQSVDEGRISVSDIDKACRRVLEAKYKLGLFDDPYKYLKSKDNVVYTAENRSKARRVAEECPVLLKNNGVLPLKSDMKIAVVGPIADTPSDMAGCWTLSSKAGECVTVLKGMKEAAVDSSLISYNMGCWLFCDSTLEFNARYGMYASFVPKDYQFPAFHTVPQQQLIAEAMDAARDADVVVAVVGEVQNMNGECSSRTDITIPDAQRELLHAMKATGKPVVMVLMTGRPLVLTEEDAEMDAILNVWALGTEGGHAVADLLYGKENPSGRLTMTFPRAVGQVPIYYNHKSTGRPHPDDAPFKKFTSCYIDEVNAPLYPFGYGLSYTSFSYENLRLSSPTMADGDSITVSVDVTNTGDRAGKETVQLYIHNCYSSSTRPVKELKGFQKIALQPGETRYVRFNISREQLGFYRHDLQWVCEPGDYDIMVGPNSRDLQSLKLTLQE